MTPETFVHPTAIVEEGAAIGEGTAIWDGVHVRGPSRIGSQCIVGEKSYIAYDVEIGDKVKINAHVYICAGVRIGDGVMVSAGTIFTNDRFPRATDSDLESLRPSEPDSETLRTVVADGATIGAGAIVGPGIEIGRWCMVGMGSVVTKSVADFHLVAGNPARSIGAVCRCGHPLLRFHPGSEPTVDVECVRCARRYAIHSGQVSEA